MNLFCAPCALAFLYRLCSTSAPGCLSCAQCWSHGPHCSPPASCGQRYGYLCRHAAWNPSHYTAPADTDTDESNFTTNEISYIFRDHFQLVIQNNKHNHICMNIHKILTDLNVLHSMYNLQIWVSAVACSITRWALSLSLAESGIPQTVFMEDSFKSVYSSHCRRSWISIVTSWTYGWKAVLPLRYNDLMSSE